MIAAHLRVLHETGANRWIVCTAITGNAAVLGMLVSSLWQNTQRTLFALGLSLLAAFLLKAAHQRFAPCILTDTA